MGGSHLELLRGTLDMLALKALSVEPMHGWGLARRLEALSSETFLIPQGSLYPALQSLLRRGFVRKRWGTSENGRRAVYYDITASGRRQLAREEARWYGASAAVTRILTLAATGRVG